MRPLTVLLWTMLLCIVFVSCSFEYDDMVLSEEEKQLIPDVLLRNLSERVYQDGDRILELRSRELMTFEGRNLQEIRGLDFSQYDDEGELYVSGRAEFASRDIVSDDILLQGDIQIRLEESGALIGGEEFLFSPDQDLIWAPADIVVDVIQEDGSVISGRGFVIDLVVQELRFDRGATGRFMESESDE